MKKTLKIKKTVHLQDELNVKRNANSKSLKPLVFKQMEEADGLYEISNLGHIRRIDSGVIRKFQTINKELRVNLYNKDNKAIGFIVNKLLIKYHDNLGQSKP